MKQIIFLLTDDSNRITDLFVDSTNTVWITTRKGVYKYNPATKEFNNHTNLRVQSG